MRDLNGGTVKADWIGLAEADHRRYAPDRDDGESESRAAVRHRRD